jgi:hypothetical protein
MLAALINQAPLAIFASGVFLGSQLYGSLIFISSIPNR